MGRMMTDSGDGKGRDRRPSAGRQHRLPWRIATAGLVVAAATLLLLLHSGNSGTPANAVSGVYNAAVDVDTATAGIQDCRAVATSAPVSVDIVLLNVDAADSDSFTAGGDMGVNY